MIQRRNIDHEAEIQAQIIAYVESYIEAESKGEDIAGWESPFARLVERGHFCAATHMEYNGHFNNFILSLSKWAVGFTINAWGTRKQWASMSTKEASITVKNGIQAVARIAVPTFHEEDYRLNGFVYRDVFNADQVEGYSPKAEELPESDIVMCAEAESYLKNLDIDSQHGGGRAYYYHPGDYVRIPPEADFKETEYSSATEGYYGTKFHEYAHATRHESRCKRDKNNDKTSYAFEELVAELSATILCCRFNISPQPREDHSKYIRSWLKPLKDDKTMIIRAMKNASTAIAWMDKQQG
jgi:antirestriction protein ArdC